MLSSIGNQSHWGTVLVHTVENPGEKIAQIFDEIPSGVSCFLSKIARKGYVPSSRPPIKDWTIINKKQTFSNGK
jgi:hypothetical protein